MKALATYCRLLSIYTRHDDQRNKTGFEPTTFACMILFIDDLVVSHIQMYRAISISLHEDTMYLENSFLDLYVVSAKTCLILICLDYSSLPYKPKP